VLGLPRTAGRDWNRAQVSCLSAQASLAGCSLLQLRQLFVRLDARRAREVVVSPLRRMLVLVWARYRAWPCCGAPFVYRVLDCEQSSVLGGVEQVDFVAIFAVDHRALRGHVVKVGHAEGKLPLWGGLHERGEQHGELLGGAVGAPALKKLLVVHQDS